MQIWRNNYTDWFSPDTDVATYNQLHIHESRSSGVFSSDDISFTYGVQMRIVSRYLFYKAHVYLF